MRRSKREYMVITFKTTTDAMSMESSCEKAGIPGRLIPVPGEIRAGCGLAWRIPAGDYRDYEARIEKLGIPIEGKTVLEI